ncbi:aminotransferase class III-fold pyridoxal phosphate-dependent enzyme [Undibacterium terreum]|uniref:Aspartate aminotransferase family protein n=1 Tax=Undibacterium terreum TaxID=1224302 RepID=A0A916UKE7_9BURK|nr:aminotransferase class III-fold pyridoxal phosphate-dependent enzyme [Undibacterium terreum]GGC75512.1 aspartate aminotransferase family protein [Undibacterium terreum]
MNIDAMREKNRQHWIHPVSSWLDQEHSNAKLLSSGKGAWLRDAEGNDILDGFSGLWCVNVGYGHESIVQAAAEQMRRLPYATGYFGYASEPAVKLAAALADIAPGNLNKVFFTLGGSDAVDTVIRFIKLYFNVTGKPDKKHFISLQRGYHGSSSTGSGLTALPAFHNGFDLPLPSQHHIPSYYPYRNSDAQSDDEIIALSVTQLKEKVSELGPENVAAFFCEPIQGSGGVIIPPVGWLAAMQRACKELGILFVVDEVITGFGRTGPMFACDAEGVSPDFMTVAKGLTAGYAPMGAVFIADHIYRAIADGLPSGELVGHGFTYSGHPVSAAIGLEVLRLYQEGGILENGRKVGEYFGNQLGKLIDHPLVGEVRSRGLLAGVELVTNKALKTKPDRSLKLGEKILAAGYQNGLIFRAFGDDIIGFAPPLCCTPAEIDQLIVKFTKSLNDVLTTKEIQNAIN